MNVSDLDIVPYPHPALRWVSKPIKKVTPLVQEVAKKMIELMHQYKGAGLSANQVALPWRLFVTCVNDKEMVFINPEVHLGRNKRDKSYRTVNDYEACLSFPGLKVPGQVPRGKDVYVEALDIEGKPFVISGPGMFARVIQHENDHLNGVLFIDRMKLTDIIDLGSYRETMKEFVDGWCNYFETQYRFINPHPKYGTDDEAKQKLVELEKILEE